jgi:hypothetical protein
VLAGDAEGSDGGLEGLDRGTMVRGGVRGDDEGEGGRMLLVATGEAIVGKRQVMGTTSAKREWLTGF